MKTNIIINGDCIDEMNKLPENSVDLIFADPPYWMRTEGDLIRVEGEKFDGCHDKWDQFNTLADYEDFTRKWLTACYRILKPTGSIWVIGGMQCIHTIGSIMQQIGFWLINDVVWHKKNPTPNFLGTRLNNSHETLLWAAKTRTSKYQFNYKTAKELNLDNVTETEHAKGIRKQMGSIWRFSVCSGSERLKKPNGDKVHPTQKPIELLKRIIAISSKKDDIVLDPFGGTATTAAAAIILGRRYIIIEREEEYCFYGTERLKDFSYIDTDIANAVFDIKPKRVSMREMIENGYFILNEPFYLKKGDAIANLAADGKLIYNNQTLSMHECAALVLNRAERVNGFDYWYVIRDGKRISIADIREQYRQS